MAPKADVTAACVFGDVAQGPAQSIHALGFAARSPEMADTKAVLAALTSARVPHTRP